MIDAPFSSPDGEPSMEKGDEENASQNQTETNYQASQHLTTKPTAKVKKPR